MNTSLNARERWRERLPGIRPVATVGRHLDAAARRLFPTITTALVLFGLAFPLSLPAAPELGAGFVLASVFFWSVYRPGSVPPPVCFALGFLADLLGPEPPGVSAIVLLAVHGVALRHRVVLLRRGFAAVWLFFAAVAAVASLGEWVLTAGLDFRALPVLPALLTATLATGFYPVLSVLLAEAHGSVAAPEQA